MLIEDKKRRDREQRASESSAGARRAAASQLPPPPMPPMEEDFPYDPLMDQLPPVYQPPVQPEVPADGIIFEEPLLVACEKEILGFVLEHGCEQLKFNRDSRYYVEGQEVTVAEFVDGTFAEDDTEFANSAYRQVYEEYFRMYDEGMEDSVIQKRLLDSMDPVTSAVAKDILIQKYQLTVENYKASLTMLGTRLVQHVPRALIVYQKNKVDIEVSRLLEQMNTAPSDQHDEILQKISEYTKIRTRLNNDLGRV
jgi:hypothetical protein